MYILQVEVPFKGSVEYFLFIHHLMPPSIKAEIGPLVN